MPFADKHCFFDEQVHSDDDEEEAVDKDAWAVSKPVQVLDQVKLSSPNACDVQIIDDEEEKKEYTDSHSKNSPSPNKQSI